MSSVTNTELARLNGVTSSVQAQLNSGASVATGLAARIDLTEAVVGGNESLNYLNTGSEKLVIRTPDALPALEPQRVRGRSRQGRVLYGCVAGER